MTQDQYNDVYEHWVDSRHAMFFRGSGDYPIIIMATPKGLPEHMMLEGYVIASDTAMYAANYASMWSAEMFEQVRGRLTFTPEKDNE